MPNFRTQELEFITKTDKYIVFCSLRDVYDFFKHKKKLTITVTNIYMRWIITTFNRSINLHF